MKMTLGPSSAASTPPKLARQTLHWPTSARRGVKRDNGQLACRLFVASQTRTAPFTPRTLIFLIYIYIQSSTLHTSALSPHCILSLRPGKPHRSSTRLPLTALTAQQPDSCFRPAHIARSHARPFAFPPVFTPPRPLRRQPTTLPNIFPPNLIRNLSSLVAARHGRQRRRGQRCPNHLQGQDFV